MCNLLQQNQNKKLLKIACCFICVCAHACNFHKAFWHFLLKAGHIKITSNRKTSFKSKNAPKIKHTEARSCWLTNYFFTIPLPSSWTQDDEGYLERKSIVRKTVFISIIFSKNYLRSLIFSMNTLLDAMYWYLNTSFTIKLLHLSKILLLAVKLQSWELVNF